MACVQVSKLRSRAAALLNHNSAYPKWIQVAIRLLKYQLVGLATFVPNAVMFSVLRACGVPLLWANGITFVVCGQLTFFLHDGFTFRDRRGGSYVLHRWLQYIPGNWSAFFVNMGAAWTLHHYGFGGLYVYLPAAIVSSIYGILWTHCISHRERTE